MDAFDLDPSEWNLDPDDDEPVWVSADGTHYFPSEMHDNHLMNAIRLCLRNGRDTTDIYAAMVEEAQRRELPLAGSDWLESYKDMAREGKLKEFWQMATNKDSFYLVAVVNRLEDRTVVLLAPTYVLAKNADAAKLRALASVNIVKVDELTKLDIEVSCELAFASPKRST